jgi:hypothetical protein
MYELHRGGAAAAATNIHVMISLGKEWYEPLLISQLMRIALAQITFNAQWELLQADGLSDSQLALLQEDWEKLEFVHPMEKTIGMERALAEITIAKWRNTPDLSKVVWGGFGSSSSAGSSGDWLDDLKEIGKSAKEHVAESFWRKSWSYDDELRMFQSDQVFIKMIRQIQTDGFFKNAMAENNRKLKAMGLDRPAENWLRDKLDDKMRELFDYGSLSLTLGKVLSAETAKQMAITAIALKRFSLKHKHFPENLTELTPEYLPVVPRDPVDGKPLRYYLNSDGTFTLYSIGKDARDGGGDPNSVSGKSRNWFEGRDVVWPQPATAAEIQSFLK